MNEAALDIIAHNVRAARAAAGLSLDALAARADVSKGAVVALEGARGNPNLATLVRVADALGRSMSSLMEDTRDERVLLADAAQIAPLWTGPQGGTVQLLLTNPRPAPVEVWRWRLHPGERYESSAHPAGITETLTVVRGHARLELDAAAHALGAGMTIAFAADVPHAYEGAGRGACELIMTVHLPLEHRNG
ncbi:MAG TPA: XRE family transcriptional regulator [Solirubrobacter sp.]|nr:XRE family transcriptional regulator [Solirubrobacter sp.]